MFPGQLTSLEPLLRLTFCLPRPGTVCGRIIFPLLLQPCLSPLQLPPSSSLISQQRQAEQSPSRSCTTTSTHNSSRGVSSSLSGTPDGCSGLPLPLTRWPPGDAVGRHPPAPTFVLSSLHFDFHTKAQCNTLRADSGFTEISGREGSFGGGS